jgi:predicted nucleic acid-binding Zn ribbon protein
LRDGFKGKALKVEVRGSVKQLIRVKEVRSISHTRDSSETTKSSRKVESEQVSVTKSTKRKNNALLYFLAAGFLIMIGFALNKFRRNSF